MDVQKHFLTHQHTRNICYLYMWQRENSEKTLRTFVNDVPQRDQVLHEQDDISVQDDNEGFMEGDKDIGDENVTLEDIRENIAMFIATMKASYVPFSFIQNVIEEVDELTQNIIDHLHIRVEPLVRDIKSGTKPTADQCNEVLEHFAQLKNLFGGLKTQRQQDRYFKEKGVFISPEEQIIGRSFVSQVDSSTGAAKQVLKDDTYQYIPIDQTIKKHLERPGIMAAILDHHSSRNDELLKTYWDASYYRDKFNHPNEVVIPLLLYNDDYESGNPLGSRKGENKISGFYVSLLCLPGVFQASLSNILLAACCKTTLVSKYGVDTILAAIVHDLTQLEILAFKFHAVHIQGL